MKTSLILIWLLIGFGSHGQSLDLVGTIRLNKSISAFSIDPEGKVYIGTRLGDLYRFLPDGSEDKHFSDIANSSVTTVEAWNRLKIFVFFRDIQKITILDRFTTSPVNYEIRDFQTDMAWLAAPGTDNSLWVLSIQYSELRKYDMQTKGLIFATPLSVNLNGATHMRAFQNLTIISDADEGLHFFDQYGNYLRKSPANGIKHFHFQDGRLVALSGDEVIWMDPFSPGLPTQKRKAPAGTFDGILISGDRYFFVKESGISIFQGL